MFSTRNRLIIGLLALPTIIGAFSPYEPAGAQERNDKFRRHAGRRIPGQYIVTLREGAVSPQQALNVSAQAAVAAIADDMVARHGGRRRHVYGNVVKGFSARMTEEEARALSSDSRVAVVEEDGQVSTAAAQASPQNWGLDRVDQRRLPLDDTYTYFSDGSGVNVYIVDTGLYVGHNAFEGRAVAAYDAVGDGQPGDQDCNGHGTHVAGIAGSSLYGVAKNVRLHGVRVLGCNGYGSWSDVIEALDWIATHHVKPAVVNASLGGGFVGAVNDAVQRLWASGVVFVAAAGNSNDNACNYSPAGTAVGIVVGNLAMDNSRADSSNFGACVDMYAPGEAIMSTSRNGPNEVTWYTGTSMAAPHVAGAAALYLQRHPSATPDQVEAAIVGGATTGLVTDHVSGANLILFTRYLGDTVAPDVALTAPAAGATLRGVAALAATASDNAELQSVSFYLREKLLVADVAAPFSTSWDTRSVPNGSYTLRAVARDLAGNARESTAPILVINGADIMAPDVALTFPIEGESVGGTVTLLATAADDVAMSRVEFLANGTLVATDSTAPFSAVWETAALADGAYVVAARAVDTSNNAAVSDATVTVSNRPAGTLPTGWMARDVGAVGSAGSTGYGAGTFTILGAGTDIWGQSDAFHFAHRMWTGDGEIVARLAEISRPVGSSFALAGLMIRADVAADAHHATLLVGADGKLKFRRRTSRGASTLSHGPSAGSITTPRWLKLTRAGDVFTAYSSADGRTWEVVGPPTVIPMPRSVAVGLWALRNGGSALARARFSDVAVTLPDGWAADDIGPVGSRGTATHSGSAYTLAGGGLDLWDTNDSFHFVHRRWSGDGDLTVQLAALSAPADAKWAMAGIMMRESLSANARHAALLVSTDGKLKFRRRLQTGLSTLSNGPASGSTAVPTWLKLSRRGNRVTAYASSDGKAWSQVYVPQDIVLPPEVEVGFWTLRNGGSGTSQARFSSVNIVSATAGQR